MTKIYTRKGDGGLTALFRGGRVSKDIQRIQAYGAIDELNSAVGWARAQDGLSGSDIDKALEQVQNDLFTIGADLATPPAAVKKGDRVLRLEEGAERFMEAEIDRLEADLEPLKSFILPGGTRAAAALHLARSICRRAEREAVTLSHQEDVGGTILKYLNRLSDLLFVMARSANRAAGVEDEKWGK